jgi:hypothetical protein
MSARKGRDSSGHVDPFYQRRRRFEAVFRPLGLQESFDRLSRVAKESLWRVKLPDPLLSYADGFPNTPADRPLRQEIEKVFREAVVEVEGKPISVRDFVGIIVGMKMALENTDLKTLGPVTAAFAQHALARTTHWHAQHWEDAVTALFHAVNGPLIHHSRLDTRLFTPHLTWVNHGEVKSTLCVTVDVTEPQLARATLDGTPRNVYRAATTWETTNVQWISWTREQLDREGGPEHYPVYVQTHALHQLHDRLNLPSIAPVAECWMCESLRAPVVVERQGNDLLVEYRVQEHRLGYLIVTPLRDKVVVRTFKILTMEGTPEARKLRARLGLTRRDVDWLRLDQLSAFTRTDMMFDVELAGLFDECGCGHLFDVEGIGGGPTPAGAQSFAAEVRKYLCLAA